MYTITIPMTTDPSDTIESTETMGVRPMNWTTAERLTLLEEYDGYPQGSPRRGALLRQHGLSSSQKARWWEQRRRGTLTPQTVPTISRLAQPRDLQRNEVVREFARFAFIQQGGIDRARGTIDKPFTVEQISDVLDLLGTERMRWTGSGPINGWCVRIQC